MRTLPRPAGLTGRMMLASGALIVVIAAAFVALLLAIADLRDSAELARDTREELIALDIAEKLVIDLETGVRGFVITGEARFLEPWHDARRAFPERAGELERLVADDPVQLRRTRRIIAAVRSYVRDYAVPLVAAARRGELSARSVAATEEGKRRVDALRAQFDGVRATERGRITDRQDRADSAARRAVVAGFVGLAGSIVLVGLFSAYLLRAIVRPIRRAAGMAGRLAGGDLATRMPTSGVGEIGVLERSFNVMAASLEQSRAELAASRARVVAAADDTRRRLERDLHDGAQQRLVSLALRLRAAAAAIPAEMRQVHEELARVGAEVDEVLDDLRELSRGIHPAILSEGGLGPALRSLARRSAVPVQLHVHTDARLPERVEVAAYYVVSEALTNVAKHASASAVQVEVDAGDGLVRLAIHDDGVGGADPARGSGLIGLNDRVEATGGKMTVESRPGAGTSLVVELPVNGGVSPDSS